MSRHTWHHQGPHKPSSCATVRLNSHWSRAATGKKSLVPLQQGHFSSVRLCDSQTVACQASPSGRGLLQARVLERIGQYCCHTLIEHYISCCPSCQLPCVHGAARTSATQAAAPPPHLALTGADPSPPGQPQEQTPVDDPHAEVEIKPQLKPRGSVTKEEDPKPSHQLYKLHIKST